MDVALLWRAVRMRARLIFACGALLLTVVMIATLVARMEFQSTARLYLGELSEQMGGTQLDLTTADNSDLGSEIEILMSQSLVTQAVASSGANVQIQRAGSQPVRFWQWLLSGRDHQLLDVEEQELLAQDGDIDEPLRGPHYVQVRFLREGKFEVWQEERRVARGALGTPVLLPHAKVTLLPGVKRSPAPGSEYDLTIDAPGNIAEAMARSLVLTPAKAVGGPAKVLGLELTHRSPGMAARFLEQLMRCYLGQRQSWKTEEATAAESFVKTQLDSLRRSLDVTEKKLADYRSSTRVVVLDSEAQALIAQVGKYEEQRVAARLQVAALGDMKRALKDPNARMEAYLLGEGTDTVLSGLASSLSEARKDLGDLQQRFSDAAPDVKQQKAQVDAHLQMISNYVTSRLTRAQESLGALNGVISQYEQKLRTVPGAELGLAQLSRESEVYSRLYSFLLERQQQAAIVKASTISKNRVLDHASRSYREASPKLGLRIASGPIGMLLGALFVVLSRVFSARLQSEADSQRALGGLPIFASVPKRPADRKKHVGQVRGDKSHSGQGKRDSALGFLAAHPHSPYAEAFRTFRTNLYRTLPAGRGAVLLVSSPAPGDGKTTCVLSLAAMLAADDKLVLVIDADVRKPSHHEFMGLGSEVQGLTDVLMGHVTASAAVRPVQLARGEYFALTAGSSLTADLLSHSRMATLMADVRNRFDYILVDSASYPLVSDPLVLAMHADFFVSVVRLYVTTKKQAAEHAQGVAGSTRYHAAIINGGPETQAYGPSFPLQRRAGAGPIGMAHSPSGSTTGAGRA